MTSLNDERFNAALNEATGDAQRIGEILRSLSVDEMRVQRALALPADIRAALEAEIKRREDEKTAIGLAAARRRR